LSVIKSHEAHLHFASVYIYFCPWLYYEGDDDDFTEPVVAPVKVKPVQPVKLVTVKPVVKAPLVKPVDNTFRYVIHKPVAKPVKPQREEINLIDDDDEPVKTVRHFRLPTQYDKKNFEL